MRVRRGDGVLATEYCVASPPVALPLLRTAPPLTAVAPSGSIPRPSPVLLLLPVKLLLLPPPAICRTDGCSAGQLVRSESTRATTGATERDCRERGVWLSPPLPVTVALVAAKAPAGGVEPSTPVI